MINFTETIADLAKDQAIDFAKDKVVDYLVEDPYEDDFSMNDDYTVTDYQPSQGVIEARQEAKVLIQKVDGKNLFSLPSIITIAFFILSACFLDIDAALMDNKIDRREGFKIAYLILGAVASLVARGSEGKTGVYTPDWCPGHNKCDFVDEDGDGIDDRTQ